MINHTVFNACSLLPTLSCCHRGRMWEVKQCQHFCIWRLLIYSCFVNTISTQKTREREPVYIQISSGLALKKHPDKLVLHLTACRFLLMSDSSQHRFICVYTLFKHIQHNLFIYIKHFKLLLNDAIQITCEYENRFMIYTKWVIWQILGTDLCCWQPCFWSTQVRNILCVTLPSWLALICSRWVLLSIPSMFAYRKHSAKNENSHIIYSPPYGWKFGWSYFWSFTAEQHTSILLNNWSRRELVLKPPACSIQAPTFA